MRSLIDTDFAAVVGAVGGGMAPGVEPVTVAALPSPIVAIGSQYVELNGSIPE